VSAGNIWSFFNNIGIFLNLCVSSVDGIINEAIIFKGISLSVKSSMSEDSSAQEGRNAESISTAKKLKEKGEVRHA